MLDGPSVHHPLDLNLEKITAEQDGHIKRTQTKTDKSQKYETMEKLSRQRGLQSYLRIEIHLPERIFLNFELPVTTIWKTLDDEVCLARVVSAILSKT